MTNDTNTLPPDAREGPKARSAAGPSRGAGTTAPNPEVAAKPRRRGFTAEYRLRILEEAERCTKSGEVGQLLRREGLYSSHLTAWRKARHDGAVRALSANNDETPDPSRITVGRWKVTHDDQRHEHISSGPAGGAGGA